MNKQVPFEVLMEDSLRESANYIKPHIENIVFLYKDTCEYWFKTILNEVTVDGIYAEFGVHNARNINQFSSLKKDIKWYGFDSFYGLNENWNGGLFPKGYLSLNGKKPEVNDNVELVVGLFQNTLDKFLKKHKKPFALLAIDCDTYESTKYVLNKIGKEKIVKGTVICFDEYLGYPGWKHNEFKAWQEFCDENKINYKYFVVSNWAVALKVI